MRPWRNATLIPGLTYVSAIAGALVARRLRPTPGTGGHHGGSPDHLTAAVDPAVRSRAGARIWHWTRVREGVVIGAERIIGTGCDLDSGVRIGSRVKLQSNISQGLTIENDVFVGPHVCYQ